MIEPYDIIRDELTLCNSEDEAKQLIKEYGYYISNKYMPDKFRYLLKGKDK